MNEIKIFENDEFGQVRTLNIDGIPYFVGKDVADALGYGNSRQAIKTNVDDDDKGVHSVDTPSGKQSMTVINESGLYSLIFGSKLESAKKFKHWVSSEVLPTIRKTGGYVNNVDLMVNTYFCDVPDEQKGLVKGLLINIQEQQKKITSLSNENDILTQKTLEWADRPLLNSMVRSYAKSTNYDYAKAWNEFKKEILYKHSINLNSRITNYLNTCGKKTKPKTLDMLDDAELPLALSTIVAMCKEKEIDISGLLDNRALSA